MSRQVRYRVTALVLGGLLLGAPLLLNGTASAEQVEGGGRQVVFGGGGVLGLSCRSTPDVESMTVPAGSTIKVVNRTGHSAKLRLGGATQGTVPDDGATDVVFRRGTTAVMLTPNCTLGNQAIPLLVTATPTNPALMPDPMPAPSGSSASAVQPGNSGTPSSSGAGSTMPDSVAPHTTAQRPSPAAANKPGAIRSTTRRPSAAAAAATTTATATQGMPPGGSAPVRIKTKVLRSTGQGSPAFAGMPPGDSKAIVSGVPTLSLPTVGEPAPAAAAGPGTVVAAAEPVASMQPLSESGPSGLLALTAIVCAIGVAAGAIRAFVSQRASRATIA
jgi:hypothetical protein